MIKHGAVKAGVSRLLFWGHMNTILGEYRGLLTDVDQWFGRSIIQSGERIRCAAGCAECCRGLFDITLLDAALLKQGFDRLDGETRERVLVQCRERLVGLRRLWPAFDLPYILNDHPEEEWKLLMLEDDETPCPLLGPDGRCLVYDYRPMTCRLHGLPLVDLMGEVHHDEWCTLNYVDVDPLADTGIRGDFTRIFREEVRLFRHFSRQLLGREFRELDTFIPTALLLDFARFDWRCFAAGFGATP